MSMTMFFLPANEDAFHQGRWPFCYYYRQVSAINSGRDDLTICHALQIDPPRCPSPPEAQAVLGATLGDSEFAPPGSCAEGPFAITLYGSRLTLAYICNWLPRSSDAWHRYRSRRDPEIPVAHTTTRPRTDNRSTAVDPSQVMERTHTPAVAIGSRQSYDLRGQGAGAGGRTVSRTETDVRGAFSSSSSSTASSSRVRAPARSWRVPSASRIAGPSVTIRPPRRGVLDRTGCGPKRQGGVLGAHERRVQPLALVPHHATPRDAFSLFTLLPVPPCFLGSSVRDVPKPPCDVSAAIETH